MRFEGVVLQIISFFGWYMSVGRFTLPLAYRLKRIIIDTLRLILSKTLTPVLRGIGLLVKRVGDAVERRQLKRYSLKSKKKLKAKFTKGKVNQ